MLAKAVEMAPKASTTVEKPTRQSSVSFQTSPTVDPSLKLVLHDLIGQAYEVVNTMSEVFPLHTVDCHVG